MKTFVKIQCGLCNPVFSGQNKEISIMVLIFINRNIVTILSTVFNYGNLIMILLILLQLKYVSLLHEETKINNL